MKCSLGISTFLEENSTLSHSVVFLYPFLFIDEISRPTQKPSLERLPDPEKAFQVYVDEKEAIALGVLTQRLGSEPQPVAYLSKRLDPTTRGWPPSLRNLAAIAIMIKDGLKLSFEDKLFLPGTK